MKAILTIGMPVFNDILFIEQSIQSILNQSFKDFIFILSDDGATDGSAEICLEYAKQDSRIKYVKQKNNLGISKNMEYLLEQCETEFFMWAGDDDLWSPDYCEIHIANLKSNSHAIVSFGSFQLIDEDNRALGEVLDIDYANKDKLKRVLYFIRNSNDAFGYGLFRTQLIRGVRFPVWKWPNKKSAYNNIYPSLCFYLLKGQYIHFNKEVLFYKREKTQKNTNHLIAGSGNGIKETIAYCLRRLNLVIFTFAQVAKINFLLAIFISPSLIWNWFFISMFSQINLALRSFYRKNTL